MASRDFTKHAAADHHNTIANPTLPQSKTHMLCENSATQGSATRQKHKIKNAGAATKINFKKQGKHANMNSRIASLKITQCAQNKSHNTKTKKHNTGNPTCNIQFE